VPSCAGNSVHTVRNNTYSWACPDLAVPHKFGPPYSSSTFYFCGRGRSSGSLRSCPRSSRSRIRVRLHQVSPGMQ